MCKKFFNITIKTITLINYFRILEQHQELNGDYPVDNISSTPAWSDLSVHFGDDMGPEYVPDYGLELDDSYTREIMDNNYGNVLINRSLQ